jgi:hypothetical protein
VDAAILAASLTASLPSQGGNSGKFITTNGTDASWAAITTAMISGLDASLAALQASDADLTTIAGLSPSNNDVLQRKLGAWTNSTIAVLKSDLSLNNCNNTSDADKPVSTATQTALDLKLASSSYTAADVLAKLLTVDGAASGIDADLLDGVNGAAYARSGANTDITAIDQDVTITATGTVASDTLGYRGLPQLTKTANYTLALADAGKHISITTGGIAIPANGTVAFPIGTAIVIFNDSGSSQNITITTDTLRLAGTATTGTRALAGYGLATLVKVATTTWAASGAGVT